MTDAVYYTDPYVQSLDARISDIGPDYVVLDRTIFYPTGGGQPGDTGVIGSGSNSIRVIDTRKGDHGAIHHMVEDVDALGLLKARDSVHLELDWERRYAHMRMHTAMHVLGSLIPVPVTGGQVGETKSRLDFDVGAHKLDKFELTEQMNASIQEDAPLEISWVSDAYLDEHPEVVRTMSVAPPRGVGDIRMIRIVDVDYQPCGGTHIRNLSEIGPVVVSKIENKGKQNRRVHIQFAEA